MNGNVQILTKGQCFHLMHHMKMMDHIVAHSCQVCRVAVSLADLFAPHNRALHRELVQASALLHDITKTRGLATGENHARTGKRLLREMGYPAIAAVIGQHVRLDTYSQNGIPTEAEIVNYADKRVLHDEVVTLRERKEYILDRYGRKPDSYLYIEELFEQTKLLENKLFSFLAFSPHELVTHLEPYDFSSDFSAYRMHAPHHDPSYPSSLN